jgi:hypothetical protein
VVNRATALQVLAMAHLAAVEDVGLEDGTVVEQHRGLGHQRLDAPALVSDQLGLSDAASSSRLAMAVDVVTKVPAVHDAMASGRLDGYRAGIVAEELRDAPSGVCREVVAKLEDSLGTEPPAMLRRRVRRVLGAVDAELVRAKAARARAARSLRRWPGDEPGVDTWLGSFPVEQARSGWAVVDGLARQYVMEGRARGVEEARADALMDLIHARASGQFVVQLAVPADRLASDGAGALDHAPRVAGTVAPSAGTAAPSIGTGTPSTDPAADDALVTVAGLGMAGETQVRRAWLESLTRSTDGTRGGASRPAAGTGPALATCHSDTGALLAVEGHPGRRRMRTTETQSYRPPPALLELVRARDGRCRFPGCTTSAVSCDLDHVRPWPSGPTEAGNLMCLCRRHHRVKQSLRWRVRIEPDATVTWTDPTGRQRTTLPLDFLQLHERDHAGAHPSTRSGGLSPGRGGPPPADELGVLWSAWEDELSHHLARGGRDRRRGGRPTLTVNRPLLHRPGVWPTVRPSVPRGGGPRAEVDPDGAVEPPPF